MAQTIKLKRSATSGAVPATSALELGEVAINTHDGKMYLKKNDGTDSVVEVSGDKLPKSGGTMTGDLNLGDDDKAQFGTGNDLQIYHDGSDSYIKNNTGHLSLYGDQNKVAIDIADGYGNSVSLMHGGSTKLFTSNGVSGVVMQYGATFRKNARVENYLNTASESQYATIKYFQAYNSFNNGLTDGSTFGGIEFYNGKSGTTTGATGYVRGVANGTSGNMNLEIQTGTAGSLTTKMLVKDAGVDVTGNIAVSGNITSAGKDVGTQTITSTTPTDGTGFPTGHVWYVV